MVLSIFEGYSKILLALQGLSLLLPSLLKSSINCDTWLKLLHLKSKLSWQRFLVHRILHWPCGRSSICCPYRFLLFNAPSSSSRTKYHVNCKVLNLLTLSVRGWWLGCRISLLLQLLSRKMNLLIAFGFWDHKLLIFALIRTDNLHTNDNINQAATQGANGEKISGKKTFLKLFKAFAV